MTRAADASLVAGVTAAAHSIVFQFTLTFRFPFDTVVEREPPACSPFYCRSRGYIGLLEPAFDRIIWFYERSRSHAFAQVARRNRGKSKSIASRVFANPFVFATATQRDRTMYTNPTTDGRLDFPSSTTNRRFFVPCAWFRRIKRFIQTR